jgi:hypothetical protein
MTEDELRALVRQAIARQRGSERLEPANPANLRTTDASHAMFPVASGADAEGPCIIEPAVMCNHCGYCKSFGH